jgi:hypothetical protein
MNSGLQAQLNRRNKRGKSELSRIRENLESQKIEAEEEGSTPTETEEVGTNFDKPVAVNPLGEEKPTRRRKITRETFADEKEKRLSIDVPETLFKAIGVYCAAEGVTRADLGFELFTKHLMKKGYMK